MAAAGGMADAEREAFIEVAFAPPLVPAVFCERPNRFVAVARQDGRVLRLHVPSTGRLAELLVPGRRVWVDPRPTARLAGRLVAVGEDPLDLVAVDAHLAERLARRLLAPHVAGVGVRVDGGAVDLVLRDGTWVEVKSVTLFQGEAALFPDAPTLRGRRQVEALRRRARAGMGAMLLFMLQGGRARRLVLHRAHDPAFAAAVEEAHRDGVAVAAHAWRITWERARHVGPVPVAVEEG
jgi:sugar fermentation stimulation protein A